ncbi:MAG: hypothetical protein HY205_05180 [Nitrospirae bacterium]|nr:hypothetical protein [Nitrospirota bacterium]
MGKHDRRLDGVSFPASGQIREATWWVLAALLGLIALGSVQPAAAAPPSIYAKEYPITVDATALTPPTWWHVPGKTPAIMTLDPDSPSIFPSS